MKVFLMVLQEHPEGTMNRVEMIARFKLAHFSSSDMKEGIPGSITLTPAAAINYLGINPDNLDRAIARFIHNVVDMEIADKKINIEYTTIVVVSWC